MKNGPPNTFRTRLLVAAACPLGTAGVVAAACPEALVAAAAAGLAFAAAAAGLLWQLTRPLADLGRAVEAAAEEGAADGLPTERRDELGRLAAAVAALIDKGTETAARLDDETARVADAAEQRAADAAKFTAALGAVAAAMGRVAAGTPAEPLVLALPDGVSGEPVAAGCSDLSAKVTAVRQRLAGLSRILQSCPLPLVATDDRGVIRFANPAAEQALGRPVAQLVRAPLGNLLRAPAEPDPTGVPSLVLTGVPDWFAQGGRPVAADSIARGTRLCLTAARSHVQNDGMWCVIARELADDHRRLGLDRARTREEVLVAALGLVEQQAGAAGEGIVASARQLIGEVKQTPQRDALVPRLKAVRDTAADLDAQVRVARWLSVALWGELPAPARSEFLAGESVRGALDLLAARLKRADVTVTVSDAGGWLYCDEDWFGTAVLGVLTHAAAAVRGAPVGVKLRRLPCQPGQSEGNLEVEVVDAGPPLTAAQAAALAHPLGDLAPSALLPTGDGQGFVPGLLLAKRLAAALGGELALDATPSGRLVVRMVVPTRLPDRNAAPLAGLTDPHAEAVAVEELCVGWRLGMSS
jgi:PAS domain-containing protein